VGLGSDAMDGSGTSARLVVTSTGVEESEEDSLLPKLD
jgi:hypothetical protein